MLKPSVMTSKSKGNPRISPELKKAHAKALKVFEKFVHDDNLNEMLSWIDGAKSVKRKKWIDQLPEWWQCFEGQPTGSRTIPSPLKTSEEWVLTSPVIPTELWKKQHIQDARNHVVTPLLCMLQEYINQKPRGKVKQKYLKQMGQLVVAGADVNWYNGRVTPMGLAAYSGQVEVVKLFHSLGGNILLTLGPEHVGKDYVGSTLLHRMADRDAPGCGEVIEYLVEQYDNPWAKRGDGKAPSDLIKGEHHQLLMDALAQKEKKALHQVLEDHQDQMYPSSSNAKPRL